MKRRIYVGGTMKGEEGKQTKAEKESMYGMV